MDILKTRKFRSLAKKLDRLHKTEKRLTGVERERIASRKEKIAVNLGQMMARAESLHKALEHQYPLGIELNPQDTERHPIAM